jgi:hypothetical protein
MSIQQVDGRIDEHEHLTMQETTKNAHPGGMDGVADSKAHDTRLLRHVKLPAAQKQETWTGPSGLSTYRAPALVSRQLDDEERTDPVYRASRASG